MSTSHNFSVWRGKRSTYNKLGIEKKLDYWTLYSVIEPDGTRSLYWGAKPTVTVTGELYPVTDIVLETGILSVMTALLTQVVLSLLTLNTTLLR